ncbi:MAG: radical SAM protein [Sedimentisphaerales bacterium]|nr:radical SAM protein [Sedimentisphaerales bacterium]
MCRPFSVGGEKLDSLDLKALVVTKGVKVSRNVYERFGRTHRIYPDPLTCNCLILPDGTIVQMTDLALHMRYLKTAILLEALRSIRYTMRLRTPFTLDVSPAGRPVLLHDGTLVTEVSFPPASCFYEQRTSSGLPYLGNAVLQGLDFLSFQCLWPCQFARSGHACQFCYSGGVAERLARKRKPDPPVPTPRDVAEMVEFAVSQEKSASHIQITGGSTINTQAECRVIVEYLGEIDRIVGLGSIPGEILVYTTPPKDPTEVDQVFAAGADRIACSLEVWDEELAKVITPGKATFAGRQRYVDCLTYIAGKYGPNRACTSFVVGVEPVESYLAGAEYLAQRGIVPIASIWIPFGRPVTGKREAPGLEYYRRVKEGLAMIYEKYHIEPPGSVGLNVCLCRDVWNHRLEINAA